MEEWQLIFLHLQYYISFTVNATVTDADANKEDWSITKIFQKLRPNTMYCVIVRSSTTKHPNIVLGSQAWKSVFIGGEFLTIIPSYCLFPDIYNYTLSQFRFGRNSRLSVSQYYRRRFVIFWQVLFIEIRSFIHNICYHVSNHLFLKFCCFYIYLVFLIWLLYKKLFRPNVTQSGQSKERGPQYPISSLCADKIKQNEQVHFFKQQLVRYSLP